MPKQLAESLGIEEQYLRGAVIPDTCPGGEHDEVDVCCDIPKGPSGKIVSARLSRINDEGGSTLDDIANIIERQFLKNGDEYNDGNLDMDVP